MSEGSEVKWLYPGAEENMEENKEMAVNKESVETSLTSSPVKSTPVTADIGQKMTAATSYMGNLFQNSWYGAGKGKVEAAKPTAAEGSEAAEDTATDTSSTTAGAAAESSESAGAAAKSSETAGAGIAKSTSAFFSSLVSGVTKVASPTEEKAPTSPGDTEKEASQSGGLKSQGLGMLSSAFSRIAYSAGGDEGNSTSQPQSPTTDGETPVTGGEGTTQQQDEGKQFSLTNAFSKVGLAASGYSKVLQDTVAPIFQEFNQEQQNFIKSKGDDDIPVSPWSAYQNEDELKEKILVLSTDQRNFLRAPPAGVEIEMDSAMYEHHALFLLKEDPRLETIRYELVPKQIKEDAFWKNYFYRVGVLQQSYEMKPVQTVKAKAPEVADRPEEPAAGKDEEDTSRTEFSTEQDDEFISDSHQVSSSDLLEADEAIKKLGLAEKGDAEWEAELEGELEYEMVEGAGGEETDNPEWEQQIQEMLDAEENGGK
jgi:hypothetical protein